MTTRRRALLEAGASGAGGATKQNQWVARPRAPWSAWGRLGPATQMAPLAPRCVSGRGRQNARYSALGPSGPTGPAAVYGAIRARVMES